ncbi:MAG: DNA-processing protein DprA [Gemmatales bacterium]|nr:DNA-processing protein DprA [Gemmatales bacterium]MCS7159449.1 DNA-processing protein DprA [Gemmatales bacterium]MDW8174648.1 DNA-processing protein DprA [Gemmatales bacterium]MDW8223889.1 DNA-processing protein DprA [Gemmatales bacterium]
MDAETQALLTLRLVPGLGPRLIRALVNQFGSAQAVLQADPQRLTAVPHLPRKLAQALRQAIATAPVHQELADIAAAGARIISWNAPEYPTLLLALPDAPPILYLRGTLSAQEPCIAVVGSRQCTQYGCRITQRLVAGLVRAGYTIVSGLARGIDAVAHQTALNQGGRTIAIFAGGLLAVYPPEHRPLAEHIAQQGALLSEQPIRMPPERIMFPARNRLISGLCQAVIVVEAGERSGALITARHAAEQGRELFVVPGPVDSPTSGGIIHLLRQGAYAVRDAQEVLDVLRTSQPLLSPPCPSVHEPTHALSSASAEPTSSDVRRPQAPGSLEVNQPEVASTTSPKKRSPRSRLSSLQSVSVPSTGIPASQVQRSLEDWPDYVRLLYHALTEEPQDADHLAQRAGLSAQELARAVVLLELQGLVRRLPGNRLMRQA